MNTYLPDQSVSDNKKLEEEWFVPTYDYYIENCIKAKNNSDTLAMIRAANGDVSEDTINYLLKPFNNEFSDLNEKLPYSIKKTDIITPIVEKIVGEYIELPYNVNVKFHDPDISTLQDMEMNEIITNIVKTAIYEKIKADEESQQESSPEDIEAYIQQKKKDYIDREILKAKHFLIYVNEKLNFDYYRYQMYYNWWTTEEVYVYRKIENGELVKEIISPDKGFPFPDSSDFIEDNTAFVWVEDYNWDEFVIKYKNKLTKQQFDYVENLVGGDKLGLPVSIPSILIEERSRQNWYRINSTSEVANELTTTSKQIRKYNIVFKTLREVKELRYIDLSTGKEQIVNVPKDYKLDKEIGDIELTKSYITETWQGCRFGSEHTGVYIKPYKHLVQRSGKLPVTGKKFILKNKKVNPIPYRLISYQIIDMMLNFHIEKTLAKYKDDILIIPQSVLAEDKSGTTAEKTFYLLKDGRIIYDDSRVDLQTIVQGLRLIQGSQTDKYISTLIELQKYYIERANEVASMNQDRLGNIDTRAGVSNVEQNIYRSKLGSILSLEIFRKILEKEHEADLEYAKYLFIDGIDDTMFDSNGKVIPIQLDGYQNFKRSYGIYIENGNKADQKLNQIKQIALSVAQSGDLESAIESVETDSIPEIKEAVKRIAKARQDFEREKETIITQREQMKEEATKELLNSAHEQKKELQTIEGDQKLDQIITQKEYDLSQAMISADTTKTIAEIKKQTIEVSNDSRERIANAKNQSDKDKEKIKAKSNSKSNSK